MAVNFGNILNKNLSDVKRPEPLPPGTYYGTIGRYETVEVGQNKTPAVRLSGRYTGIGDDVDPADLPEGTEIEKKNWNFNFFITEDAMWRLSEFCTNMGVAADNLGQAIAELVGKDVQLSVEQIPTREGDAMVHVVRNVAPVA